MGIFDKFKDKSKEQNKQLRVLGAFAADLFVKVRDRELEKKNLMGSDYFESGEFRQLVEDFCSRTYRYQHHERKADFEHLITEIEGLGPNVKSTDELKDVFYRMTCLLPPNLG